MEFILPYSVNYVYQEWVTKQFVQVCLLSPPVFLKIFEDVTILFTSTFSFPLSIDNTSFHAEKENSNKTIVMFILNA